MSILRENELKKARVIAIAEEMILAARTAPKAKGRDTVELLIVEGLQLEELACTMEKIAIEFKSQIFSRDAKNIRIAEAIVLVGTRIQTLGLNEVCQLCGFKNCEEKEKHPSIPCIYNIGDLNLALGSAANVAGNHHVDNRIMFTVGKAAINLNYFEQDIKVAFGIPLSVSSKNPFFDRK